MAARLLPSVLLVATAFQLASSDPYMLLTNARPKCVQITATQDSTIIINYEAPDLVILEELEKELKIDEEEPDDNIPPGSGRDAMWYQRNKQRLAAMRMNMGQSSDFVITAAEKSDMDQANRARWRRGQNTQPLARIREDIKAKSGQVKVDTTQDGKMDICSQSLSASHAKPIMVGLWIVEDTQKKNEAEAEKKASQHLNVIEGTTKALIRKMDMILRTADFAKEQEYEFHQKSLAMNRASHYGPMIRVVVLFITGFTFAHHIVNFFKTHHI
uniref:GOLD domain-containing protein n=2 Tax=Odontella aurita TaxID=265563 RepID=A0A7S4HZV1_9STRA